MPKDSLKGLKAAQKNRITNIRPKSDWRRPDNKICLISDCQSKVYSDGQVFYSLCLHCLQELELGPFFKRKPQVNDDDWPERGVDSACIVAEALIRRELK